MSFQKSKSKAWKLRAKIFNICTNKIWSLYKRSVHWEIKSRHEGEAARETAEEAAKEIQAIQEI